MKPKGSECKKYKSKTKFWNDSFRNLTVSKEKTRKNKNKSNRLLKGSKNNMHRLNDIYMGNNQTHFYIPRREKQNYEEFKS